MITCSIATKLIQFVFHCNKSCFVFSFFSYILNSFMHCAQCARCTVFRNIFRLSLLSHGVYYLQEGKYFWLQCRDQKFMFLNVFMLSLLVHAMAFSCFLLFNFIVPLLQHSAFSPIDSTAPN